MRPDDWSINGRLTIRLLAVKHAENILFYSESHEIGRCGSALRASRSPGRCPTNDELAAVSRGEGCSPQCGVMNQNQHVAPYRQTMNPARLATPGGHYSHVAIANGFVFVSGQLPIDATGAKLTEQPFEVQAERVLANLAAALAGAGSDIEKLVQVRVYLVDVAYWASFNEIYARWAGDARPARAVVPVPALHFGLKIEIEATALA
jgi:reactive intermediate/imine deaminase